MNQPQWGIKDLFLLTLIVGVLGAIYVVAWNSSAQWYSPINYSLLAIGYLSLMTTATLAAIFGRPSVRRFCMGYAAISWLLAPLMLFSHWIGEFQMVPGAGVAAGVICGVLAHWLLEPPGKKS